jgi:hypothetical protein
MTRPHDTGYKLLFSHPEMVRDLLLGYVPGEWVHEADFDTLEHVNGSYVSDNERQRHDDMVWRLKLRDRWLWVYLVLEFQSTPDPWMALRMLVYVGLLAQDLVRKGELHPEPDGRPRLPPILPIVLYNGLPRWQAPIDVADCFVAPPLGLEDFRPALMHHLIDEARLKLHPAAAVRNFAEALFRLEHGRTPNDMRHVLQALDRLLKDDASQPLRRTFGIWVKRLLRRKVPKSKIEDVDRLQDIMEADHMLAERIEGWFEEAARKGLEQGMQQGKRQGAAHALERLLTRRFGTLPEWVSERLDAASDEKLDAWLDAVLTADSLDEVFGRE